MGEAVQQTASRRTWPWVAFRGVVAILFGVIALAWPKLTVGILVYLFGAYALVDGLIHVVHSLSSLSRQGNWWADFFRGLASVAVGVAVFVWPEITAFLLLIFIAIRAPAQGVLDIVSAIVWREQAVSRWLLALGGFVSVVFGLFVLLRPGAGALALLWLIALYAVAVGFVQLILAYRLHRREQGAGPVGAA